MKMVAVKVSIAAVLIAVYIQGAVAGETNNCRCTRLPYNKTIGTDIAFWSVIEDVGRCEEICHNNVATEGNTEGYSCEPTEMVTYSYPLAGDVRYKSVIHKCGYQNTSVACRRQSLYKTFFKGTKYSRRHDIGSCVGVCGINGHECKAIDSRKVAIKGPNGDADVTVSVIKKCGCVNPECYRVAFREVYKRKSEKGWVQEEKDVGMCVGAGCSRICEFCSMINIKPELCNHACRYFRDTVCMATDHTTKDVYTGDFKAKKIRIIKNCECSI